jgi:hypothetical protein
MIKYLKKRKHASLVGIALITVLGFNLSACSNDQSSQPDISPEQVVVNLTNNLKSKNFKPACLSFTARGQENLIQQTEDQVNQFAKTDQEKLIKKLLSTRSKNIQPSCLTVLLWQEQLQANKKITLPLIELKQTDSNKLEQEISSDQATVIAPIVYPEGDAMPGAPVNVKIALSNQNNNWLIDSIELENGGVLNQ